MGTNIFTAELKEQVRDGAYSAWSIGLPLATGAIAAIVAGQVSGAAAARLIAGTLFAGMGLTGIMNAPLSLAAREEAGFYKRIALAPKGMGRARLGALGASAAIGSAASLVAVGLAWLLGARPAMGIGGFALWTVTALLLFTGAGAVLGKLCRGFMAVKAAGNLVMLASFALSGIAFELEGPLGFLHRLDPVWWWMEWGKALAAGMLPSLLEIAIPAGAVLLFAIIALRPRAGIEEFPSPVISAEKSLAEIADQKGGGAKLPGRVVDEWKQGSWSEVRLKGVNASRRMGLFRAIVKEKLSSKASLGLEIALLPLGVLAAGIAGGLETAWPWFVRMGVPSVIAVGAAWELSRGAKRGLLRAMLKSPEPRARILARIVLASILPASCGVLLSAGIALVFGVGSSGLAAVPLAWLFGAGAGLAGFALVRDPVALATAMPFLFGALGILPSLAGGLGIGAGIVPWLPGAGLAGLAAGLHGSAADPALAATALVSAIAWPLAACAAGCFLALRALKPR